ncbi:hypothetical protein [Amycolatopsis sp. cmx-8-4]|uniref:hypothetical protein n=1 Tax=Amycolatopsis sp. cmx-8-4 TaxID=2790947 RepID=UPI003978EA15
MTARLKQLLVVLLILFGVFAAFGTTTGATSWDAPVAAAGPSVSTQDTLAAPHAVLRVAATAPAPHTWWAVHPPSPDSSAPHRTGRVLDAPSTRSAVSLPTSQSTRAPPAR